MTAHKAITIITRSCSRGKMEDIRCAHQQ